jgi:hypothetical protein
MTPKERFNFMLEPGQLAALRAIEVKTAAPVGAQIRRAVQTYLEAQTVLTKSELRKIQAAEG